MRAPHRGRCRVKRLCEPGEVCKHRVSQHRANCVSATPQPATDFEYPKPDSSEPGPNPHTANRISDSQEPLSCAADDLVATIDV
jgi:hypothetical protein